MISFPTLSRPPQVSSAAVLSSALCRELCEQIVAHVARDFSVEDRLMLAHGRGVRDVARARQVAMYLAHVSYGLDFAAIGRAFHRDRTTVSHACQVVEECRDDAWFDRRVTALERICHKRISFTSAAGGRR